jgi:hypothetical protein
VVQCGGCWMRRTTFSSLLGCNMYFRQPLPSGCQEDPRTPFDVVRLDVLPAMARLRPEHRPAAVHVLAALWSLVRTYLGAQHCAPFYLDSCPAAVQIEGFNFVYELSRSTSEISFVWRPCTCI